MQDNTLSVSLTHDNFGPVQTSIFLCTELNIYLGQPITIQSGQLIQTSNLISQTQFIFTIFNGLKLLQVQEKINCSIIYALGLEHEKFDV